jgi:hypothetical protein
MSSGPYTLEIPVFFSLFDDFPTKTWVVVAEMGAMSLTPSAHASIFIQSKSSELYDSYSPYVEPRVSRILQVYASYA